MTNLERLNSINTNCLNPKLYAWIMNLLEYQTFDESSIVNEIDVYHFLEDEYTGELYEDDFSIPKELLVKVIDAFLAEAKNVNLSYFEGAQGLCDTIKWYIN